MMAVNFSLLALDQSVDNVATIRHMSGGQFALPPVIRMATRPGAPAWDETLADLGRLICPHRRNPAALEDARSMRPAHSRLLFGQFPNRTDHRSATKNEARN